MRSEQTVPKMVSAKTLFSALVRFFYGVIKEKARELFTLRFGFRERLDKMFELCDFHFGRSMSSWRSRANRATSLNRKLEHKYPMKRTLDFLKSRMIQPIMYLTFRSYDRDFTWTEEHGRPLDRGRCGRIMKYKWKVKTSVQSKKRGYSTQTMSCIIVECPFLHVQWHRTREMHEKSVKRTKNLDIPLKRIHLS